MQSLVRKWRLIPAGSSVVANGVVALLSASPLMGCGNYDPEPRSSSETVGELNTAGQMGEPSGSGGTGNAGSSSGGSASGTMVTPVEAACTNVAPCGGNVVGTWVVAGSCLPVSNQVDMSGFGLGCIAAPVTGALEVTGSWTANADGTFRDETTTTGESQIQLPAECLNVSGTVTSCDRLDGALQALGFASVTCQDGGNGGCACTATVDQTGGLAFVSLDASASGSYSTMNDVITTATRTPAEYAYCVSEDRLILTPQTVGRTGALTGTIVLVRP